MADNLMIPPLYQNSKVSMQKMEPVYTKLFRAIITPPAAIGTSWELMHEQIKSVEGVLPYKTAGASVAQTFQGDERHFAKAGTGSHATELTFNVNINVQEDLKLVGYYEYREWAKLVYDTYTGAMTLKKDYEGGPITIYQFRRDGEIIHEWNFPFAIPSTEEMEHGDFDNTDDEGIWGNGDYALSFMCDGGSEKTA